MKAQMREANKLGARYAIILGEDELKDKLGTYITKLMTTILDTEQEEFVKNLAFSELKRLNVDIEEFLRKNSKDDSEEIVKTKKVLLQEDKENVK